MIDHDDFAYLVSAVGIEAGKAASVEPGFIDGRRGRGFPGRATGIAHRTPYAREVVGDRGRGVLFARQGNIDARAAGQRQKNDQA